MIQAGADITLEDKEGHTAAQIGEQYSHQAVADTIKSPREKYRPEFPIAYMDFLAASAQVGGCTSPHLPQPDTCTILYDEHIDWRDPGGASLLHVACWTGNLELFRAFCLDSNVSGVVGVPVVFILLSRVESCFPCQPAPGSLRS